MLFPGHAKSLGLSENVAHATVRNDLHHPLDGSNGWKTLEDTRLERSSRDAESTVNSRPPDEVPSGATRVLSLNRIPISVTGLVLRRVFGDFGDIEGTIPTENDFSSEGSGQVTYSKTSDAVRAFKVLNGKKIFKDSGVPVDLRFVNDHNVSSERWSTRDYDVHLGSRSPVDRINEWFAPRKKDPARAVTRQDGQASRPGPKVSRSTSETWPNGEPPKGPKSRHAEISPPPVRHPNSFRPSLSYDSYRPSASTHLREGTSSEWEYRRDKRYSWASVEQDFYSSDKFSKPAGRAEASFSNVPVKSRDADFLQGSRTIYPSSLQWRRTAKDTSVNTPLEEDKRHELNYPNQLELATNVGELVRGIVEGEETNGREIDSNVHFDASNPSVEAEPRTSNLFTESVTMGAGSEETQSPADADRSPRAPRNLVPNENFYSAGIGHEPNLPALPNPETQRSSVTNKMNEPDPITILNVNSLSNRRLRINDETASLRSEGTTSDKTGASTTSSTRKRRQCVVCTAGEEFFLLYKCSICQKRCHEACGMAQKDTDTTKSITCCFCAPKWSSVPEDPLEHNVDRPKDQNSQKIPTDESTNPHSNSAGENRQATLDTGASEEGPETFGNNVIQGSARPIPQKKDQHKQVDCDPEMSLATFDNPPIERGTVNYTHQNGEVPIDSNPTKRYTCAFWKRGTCRYSEAECHFAHRETGLVAGQGHCKNITCFYWKRDGRCRHSNETCIYAHHDTGIYAPQPGYWRHGDLYRSSTSLEPPVSHSSVDQHLSQSSRVKTSDETEETASYNLEQHFGRISPISTSEHPEKYTPQCNGFVGHISNENLSFDDATNTNLQEKTDHDLGTTALERTADVLKHERGITSSGPNIRPIDALEPSKYFAKRSGLVIDPRLRKPPAANKAPTNPTHDKLSTPPQQHLNHETAATRAKNSHSSATPNETSGSKLTKRCEKCQKLLFSGTSSVCRTCSDKQVEHGGHQDNLYSTQSQRLTGATQTAPVLNILTGFDSNTADVYISPTQKKDTESFKTVEKNRASKRLPGEEGLFIQRKRRKLIMTPQILRNDSEIAPFTPISPTTTTTTQQIEHIEQPKKSVEAPTYPSLQELTEMERLRRENTEQIRKIAELEKQLRKSILPLPSEVEPEGNEKFSVQMAGAHGSPTLVSTREQTKLQQGKVPASNQVAHSGQSSGLTIEEPIQREMSLSVTSDDSDRLQCQELSLQRLPLTPRPSVQVEIPLETDSSQAAPLHRRQPDFQFDQSVSSKISFMPHVACEYDRSRRRRCLHNSRGKLDPERCRTFLVDYNNKSDTKRTVREMMDIRVAAGFHPTSTREEILDSETDESSDASIEEESMDIGVDLSSDQAMTTARHQQHKPNQVTEKTNTIGQTFAWKQKDELTAAIEFKRLGIQFDSSSDADCETGEENSTPSHMTIQAGLPKRQDPLQRAPQASRNLFDVAPECHPTQRWEHSVKAANFMPPINNQTTPYQGMRKTEWKNLLKTQCRERRREFGDPHWEVVRDGRDSGLAAESGSAFPTVKTLEERRMIPPSPFFVLNGTATIHSGLPASTGGAGNSTSTNPLVGDLFSEAKVVDMFFEKFLGGPERPVACVMGQRNKILAWREGKRDLDFTVGGGTGLGNVIRGFRFKRVRVPEDEKWPVGGR